MWRSKHCIDLTKINTTGLKNSPHCYPWETETLMSSWQISRERFSESGSPFDLPTFASIASINRFDSSGVLKVFWSANWFFRNCLGIHKQAFHRIVLNLLWILSVVTLLSNCERSSELFNKSKLELFQIQPNLLSLWSQISSGMIDLKTNCTCGA